MKEDPDNANDKEIDHNQITQVIFTMFFLKTLKLMFIIFTIVYFTGVFWYIFITLNHFYILDNMETIMDVTGTPDTFYQAYFKGNGYSRPVKILKSSYFAFTSLSTVGFGDMYPKSSLERLMCAIILFAGVIVFTYIIGIFNEIIDQVTILMADLDDADKLQSFFGLIKHYNEDEDMDLELKRRIEHHFDFKWKKDLNQAFDDE